MLLENRETIISTTIQETQNKKINPLERGQQVIFTHERSRDNHNTESIDYHVN